MCIVTGLVIMLNTTTNNHDIQFHAKMKREESLNVGTQNFLGCSSKSRCLQEVRIASDYYMVLTGHKMSI